MIVNAERKTGYSWFQGAYYSYWFSRKDPMQDFPLRGNKNKISSHQTQMSAVDIHK